MLINLQLPKVKLREGVRYCSEKYRLEKGFSQINVCNKLLLYLLQNKADIQMQSIEDKVHDRILKINRGILLFPDDFAAFGSPEAIRLALHRLEKEKQITRVPGNEKAIIFQQIANEKNMSAFAVEKERFAMEV